MKRALWFLAFTFLFSGLFAQKPNATVFTNNSSKDLFANLSKSVVTTGILRDKTTGEIDWQKFMQDKANSCVSNHIFRQIYFELYNSSLDNKSLPKLEDIVRKAYSEQDKHTFLVSVVDVNYQKIKSSEKSNLKASNGHLVLTKSMLQTENLFVAGIPAQREFTSKSVIFDFNPAYYITNKQKPSYFLVDFGDGHGARRVVLGDKIKVKYSNDGNKVVTLTAYYPDGSKESSSFKVSIKTAKVSPNEVWNVTAKIPYNGVYGKVEVGIFYGAGHSTLVHPVVIVDGFDPENSRGIAEIYQLANQQNMFDDLLAKGYDAVVINNLAGADYIQRNAFAFIEVLNMVNDRMEKAGTYQNKIVVIGPSMGGLITRYGLRYMELHGMRHNVRTWISFDSPQRGATVPLGLQHWVRFFADEGKSEDAQRALDALDAPAAQQMLIYHYTSTYTGQFPNPSYYDFYSEINQMGFPTQCRRVAIIDGSGYGNGQPYGPGAQLIYYHYNSFLVDIVGDVWALPDENGSNRIFHGIIDILGPWYDEETITYQYTLPLDGAPGGETNTLEQMDNIDPGHGDIVAMYKNHCFIPTISSLALNNVYDPYYNVDANRGNFSTPFDAIYYPKDNQMHMNIDQEAKQWFLQEITNQTSFYPAKRTVNTTTMLYPTDQQLQVEVQKQNNKSKQILVYPNPVDNYLVIRNAYNARMKVVDVSGSVILNKKLDNDSYVLNTSDWQAGVYFVTLINGQMSRTFKVVKK